MVYSPELLTPLERQNLLRWDWAALAPLGDEGRDYQRLQFYQSAADPEEWLGADEGPVGFPCGPGQHLTLPLPTTAGQVRLECAGSNHSKSDPRRSSCKDTRSSRDRATCSDGCCVSRAKCSSCPWRVACWKSPPRPPSSVAAPGSSHSIRQPRAAGNSLTRHVRCAFLAPPARPLEYSITAFRGQATPFCLSLRRLSTTPAQQPGSAHRPHVEVASVEYRLLDGHGQVLRQGALTTRPDLSLYDRGSATLLDGAVTDPASYYFALAPEVHRVQIRAADDSVAIAAFTRPPDLIRTWRLPEELTAYDRSGFDERTWFLLQPDAAPQRLSDNQTVTILTQLRPLERDDSLLEGMYLWEDFVPQGFWKGRQLLMPRESVLPVRGEALASTFCQLSPHRTYQVQLQSASHDPWVEPRLIYAAPSELRGPVRIWLNNRLWHSFRPRARRGEVVLPRQVCGSSSTSHALRIEADSDVQLYLSHLSGTALPLSSKRLIPQFENGRLRFTVTKRSAQAEGLMLRPFVPRDWPHRVQIQVRIEGQSPRAEGPFESWTLLTRAFDLLPQADQPTLVLEQDDQWVDGGRRCFFRLAGDLPAGQYTVAVQLQEPLPPMAYATLYRVLPGQHPQRRVELDAAVAKDVTSGTASPPVTPPSIQAHPQAEHAP